MNIKNRISNVLSGVFVGLTLLGILLIVVGAGLRGKNNGAGETNIYFVIIGIVLILPFAFYMIKAFIKQRKRPDKDS